MKNKVFVIIIFLIGFFFIVYPAIKQPIWLDEVYSLYFARIFSLKNLLFSLPETHPGGYYILVKFLLNFTTNLFLLRLVSSIIPYLFGCFLVYKYINNLYLTAILLLNPFFIYQNTDLRMYGITFLLSVIFYLICSKKNVHEFLILIIFVIISTLFSFSLIIPVFVFCLYKIIYKNQKKYLIPLIVIPVEFVILKGVYSYKNYAELASWISSPNFLNIPSNLTTLLGFNTDINSLLKFNLINSCIFYLIGISFVVIFSKKHLDFKIFFTIPLMVTILVSIIFPIISQRFFFYLFIPKLSLFIPRFMLPISIYFYITLYKNISPLKSQLLLFIFVLLSINPYIRLNTNFVNNCSITINRNNKEILLPSWENLCLNSKFTLNDINNVSVIYNEAKLLEQQLLKEPIICTLYHQYSEVTYINQSVGSLLDYQNKIKSAINFCNSVVQ